jgi:hypothetical protein
VFRQPGAPDPGRQLPAGLVRRVWVVDLPAHSRSFSGPRGRNANAGGARSAARWWTGSRASGVRSERALEGRRYDIGIVEHFWCAPYAGSRWPGLRPDGARSAQHRVGARPAVRGGGKRRASVGPSGICRASLKLERTWLPRFSEVLAASESDAERARAIAPGARVTVYPNALPRTPLPAGADEDAIVFSGNMEYHPNISAVRFFRREVWPLLRERWPGLVWRLIGKNPEAVRQVHFRRCAHPGTGAGGRCHPGTGARQVAVVPVLAGSGTRLKILEAWAAGLPVVSTTLGAEGLGARDGESLLLAEGGAGVRGGGVAPVEFLSPAAGIGQGRTAFAGAGIYMGESLGKAGLLTREWLIGKAASRLLY